ncbi:MAG: sensor histidine kinase [Anaerolineae bacterium]|nr:sensor histidine kinase [Anaerolineae bacterium]
MPIGCVALRELLDNALRFTPAGGVWRCATRVAGGVTIEVQDSGPGIPSEMQPYIFDRFYRQDISHSTPGFGLGLPVNASSSSLPRRPAGNGKPTRRRQPLSHRAAAVKNDEPECLVR